MKKLFATAVVCLALSAALAAPARAQSVFDQSRSRFDYDKSQPLNAKVELVEQREYYTKYHVYYDSTNGERVPAFLFVPRNVHKYSDSLDPATRGGYDKRVIELDGPRWPVIFFMHWLQSDKSLADIFAPDWAKYGYAVLAIDGIWKGERSKPGRSILETEIKDTLWNLTQQVIDCRRGVDFLETRDDIDISRLGYFGISMGAMTGAITTAVDERFKVVVLADGAGDFSVVFKQASLPEVQGIVKEIEAKGYSLDEAFNILKPVDPVEYVGHISPRPLLMINGKKDEILPYDAMVAFHETAKAPKRVIWYNSGHILPVPNVIIETLNSFRYWFDRFSGKIAAPSAK
jgi:uncharacterized protein